MYVVRAVLRDHVKSPFHSTHVQPAAPHQPQYLFLPPRTDLSAPSPALDATVGIQRFSQFRDRARILQAADPSWNAFRKDDVYHYIGEIDVCPERRSPCYHETCLALESVEEGSAVVSKPRSVWLRMPIVKNLKEACRLPVRV